MGKERVQCDNCGEVLERYPSHINESNFCDKDCMAEWQSENLTGSAHPRYSKELVECDWCGAEIERIPARREKYDRHFCDKKCKGNYYSANPEELHERDRVSVECAHCGESLGRRQHRVDRNDRHFCGRECKAAWWSNHFRGEDHPNWRGGFDDYYGENWPQQRRQTRKRDRYNCFLCGLSDTLCELIYGRELEVHHVIRKDDFDDLTEANRLGNLLTLCRLCHHAMHNDPTLG